MTYSQNFPAMVFPRRHVLLDIRTSLASLVFAVELADLKLRPGARD